MFLSVESQRRSFFSPAGHRYGLHEATAQRGTAMFVASVLESNKGTPNAMFVDLYPYLSMVITLHPI